MSYWNRVAELKKEPLHERKQSANEFYEAMKSDGHTNDNMVAERIGWLLDGNYGQEEYNQAHRILKMSGRANKVAQLSNMIAVLEWSCPPEMAVKMWKKLTAAEKAALDAAIKREIKSAQESE